MDLTTPLPPPTRPEPAKIASGVKRLWNALKPPPAAREDSPISAEDRKRQRRIVAATLGAIAIGGLGYGAYWYVASAPARAQQAYLDGMKFMATGNFNQAEARFTKAVNTSPSLSLGYLERGLARRSMNRTDPALEDFKQALSADPNLAQAHTELGLIYRDRGDIDRAISEFTESLKLAPTTDAFYERGLLYATLGQRDKALADYNAAIHQQPDAPYVYRARAVLRDALGDAGGAQEDRKLAAYIELH